MKSVVWISAILALLFLSPAHAQDDPPNLTGKWILNQKLSDDFAEVMKEAGGGGQERPQGGGGRGGGGGKGGGGRGGGGRGGGGRGGGSRGGGDDQNADRQTQDQERLNRALEEYSRLEIFHDGIELNVTNGLDITRLLYTDGREMTIWTQRGEAKATATWQDQMLMVTWKSGQESLSRVRKYTLSDEGQKLTLLETMHPPGQDQTIEITMVYDLDR